MQPPTGYLRLSINEGTQTYAFDVGEVVLFCLSSVVGVLVALQIL